MEIFLVALGIVAIIAAYFCFGIVVKFALAWWILALGVPALLVIGITLGWIGAITAIIGFCALLSANNRWQDSELYLALERKVDSAFYLSDT